MGHYMWISLRVTNSISCKWLGSVLETRYPTWSSSEVTGEKGWYVDHCRIMKIVGAVTVALEKGGNLDLVWKALFCLRRQYWHVIQTHFQLSLLHFRPQCCCKAHISTSLSLCGFAIFLASVAAVCSRSIQRPWVTFATFGNA
jgi:hypothetical protein